MVKNMQNILKKNKKHVKFVLIIVIIGVVSGLFYYHFLSNETKLNIASTLSAYENFRYNSIIKDLVIMSLILVLSFFVLGVPLSIYYLFYESLSIGFLINIFLVSFGIKGLAYIILYILINKLTTFILMTIFIQKSVNISRYIIGLFIYKNDSSVKDKLFLNFKNSLYIIIFVLIMNVILYFISPYIFNNLKFLIK